MVLLYFTGWHKCHLLRTLKNALIETSPFSKLTPPQFPKALFVYFFFSVRSLMKKFITPPPRIYLSSAKASQTCHILLIRIFNDVCTYHDTFSCWKSPWDNVTFKSVATTTNNIRFVFRNFLFHNKLLNKYISQTCFDVHSRLFLAYSV